MLVATDLARAELLWKAADALRGQIDAAEYKHVVLGLLFLKYISDSFQARRSELTVELAADGITGPQLESLLENRDEYTAERVFWVPPESRWQNLQSQATRPEIATLIDVWLSQKLMAQLYDVDVRTINYHLKTAFADSELEAASVIQRFRITAADGKGYDTQHYKLAAIIAVGYKVNSERAVQFRKWASGIVESFTRKGFAMDVLEALVDAAEVGIEVRVAHAVSQHALARAAAGQRAQRARLHVPSLRASMNALDQPSHFG